MVVLLAASMVLVGCSAEDVGTGRDAGMRRDAGRDGSALLDGAGSDAPGDDDAGMGGAREHDLDRDGVPETDLGVATCPADAARLCLVAETDARTWGVTLPMGAKPAGMGTATMNGRPLRVIGDHAGGALSE